MEEGHTCSHYCFVDLIQFNCMAASKKKTHDGKEITVFNESVLVCVEQLTSLTCAFFQSQNQYCHKLIQTDMSKEVTVRNFPVSP